MILGSNYLLTAQEIDTDLINAIIDKDEKKVFYLLKSGSNPNSESFEGVTPLMYAAETGNYYITNLLLKNGADVNKIPNSNKTTALMAAAKKNNVEIVELLLSYKADINTQDNKKNTPLIYTAYYGYPKMAEILCENGADISIKGNKGDALQVASYFGDNEIIEVLFEKEVDVNTKDELGYTALMSASQKGHLKTVKILTGKEAKLNEHNFDGFSALDLAVQNGHKEVVEYLLEKGAEIGKGDKNNISTITIAETNDRQEIGKLISKSNKRNNGKPYFNKFAVSLPMNFNKKDFLLGIDYGAYESKYKFDLTAGYLVRPYRKKVFIKEEENLIFRYREHTNLLYAGLHKHISFKQKQRKESGLLFGAKESFRFGNYKGSNKKVREFIFSPEIGYYFISSDFLFKINYEYSDFKTFKNINHRVNLAIGFVISKGYKYSGKYIAF